MKTNDPHHKKSDFKENEKEVSAAFSKQAPHFDQLNRENQLSIYLRELFRKEVLQQIKSHGSILELNCGTGLDAVYFAEKGHSIYALDIAPGMIEQVQIKIGEKQLEDKIRTKLLSFHHIDSLQGEKFDHITSNFGGLNCTADLQDVLKKLSPLLNSGGKITFMIMPKCSPWELLQVLRGKFKLAFRRFKKDTPAHLEGHHFFCYYYNPNYVISALGKDFQLLSLRGVSVFVPPESYQHFVERYPRLFRFLKTLESMLSGFFPFNRCCDHYLISLRKR